MSIGLATPVRLFVLLFFSFLDVLFGLVLRALAEGRIGWGFWPSGTPVDQIAAAGGDIWIPHDGDNIYRNDTDSESDVENEAEEPATVSQGEEDTEEDNVGITGASGIGRFGALAINDTEDGEDNDSEDSN